VIAACFGELEKVFGWLLTASWQASVLALLVLGLQFALRGRLNPRWRYALWLIVIVRLLLPIQIESPLSLFQFAPTPSPAFTAPITRPLFAPDVVSMEPLASTALDYSAAATDSFSPYSILALMWLLGVITLGGLTFEANRRFMRQAADAQEITDAVVLQLFESAQAELPTRRAIRLIESAQVDSPAIMGLIYPTLLLPKGARETFDRAELRLIFLHELAHLKRGDVVAQSLIALFQILHWFNPLLWFAFRRMRADREPAADALVLACAGEVEKERYGLMLIKMIENFQQRHSLPTLVGILEDKDSFKRRFLLISRFTTGAYGWSLLGVACLAVLSTGCLAAKGTPSVSGLPDMPSMSQAEANSRGIAALVNGKPVFWSDPTDYILDEARIRSQYKGETLRRKMAEQRYFQRELHIERFLDVQEAEAEGYRVPPQVVDDRVNFGVKGFHGDKAAFVENLRRNGQTLEQFNEKNRDDVLVDHEMTTHVGNFLDKFVRERFPSIELGTHPPTKEQADIIEAEHERLESNWRREQRAHAVIQLFDDPEYPGARPPDFISKLVTQAAPQKVTPALVAAPIVTVSFPSTPETDGALAGSAQKKGSKSRSTEDSTPRTMTITNGPRTARIKPLLDMLKAADRKQDRGNKRPRIRSVLLEIPFPKQEQPVAKTKGSGTSESRWRIGLID
jgi:beta-lactamase regulating signal transducer with metallopeptidase domain